MNTDTNKSICYYPWNHSYIGSRYERKLCCMSQDIVRHSKTTTDEFWNSESMREIRLKMLRGEEIKNCSECYSREKLGISSLRKESFGQAEEEIISRLIEMTSADGSIETGPSYFDYRTIHCNLQCVSCGEKYSSQHANLSIEMNDSRRVPFEIDYEYENTMVDEIIDALKNRKLERLYWAGGEPMMSHVHWKVVEEMEKIKLEDPAYLKTIFVHYNTNLTRSQWKGKSIPELISFYQPTIHASLDGTHETFDFCRDGASWDVVSENWKQYFSFLNEKKQFGVASVLSSPVLMDIDRWFDFYEPYDPDLHLHKLVSNPKMTAYSYEGFLDIRYFPDEIFNRIIDHAIDRFTKSNLRRKEKTIDILNSYKVEKQNMSEIFDNGNIHKLLKKRTITRDRFRKTNRTYGELLQIIDPEAHRWYTSIENTK